MSNNNHNGDFTNFINMVYYNLYYGNKKIVSIFGNNTFNFYWDNKFKALFLWLGKDYIKKIKLIIFYCICLFNCLCLIFKKTLKI